MDDDLDDVLNDLLADTAPKKKTGGGLPPGAKAIGALAKGQKGRGDDFYSALAEAAGEQEEVSEVSDADPKEMAKRLTDMDDMDAALFGKKAPAVTKSPAKPAPKSKDLDDFADLDDLDDLLGESNNDTVKKPTKSALKKPQSAESADIERPSTGDKANDTAHTHNKKPVSLTERPPTRSGTNTSPVKPRKDDHMFDDDDDDVLGGMGLESPRRSLAQPSRATPDADAEHRPGGAKSILDDLLGKESVSRHLEKPGSAGRREFTLDTIDRKISRGEPKKEEAREEDFQFGSYMPSSAAGSGSRPSSRRSVKFEDEDSHVQ